MKWFWKRRAAAKVDEGERFRFDFTEVKDVDDATVAAFFAATHANGRRLPLLIAGYVASKYEDLLTQPGKMDALQMSEVRGALKALRWFANCYQVGVKEWEKRGGGVE